MDVGIQAEVAKVGVVGSSLVSLLVSNFDTMLRHNRLAPAAWVPTVIARVNGARAPNPNLITIHSFAAATPCHVQGVVVRQAA